MGAVDRLAKRARHTSVCGNCPHSGGWHEQTEAGNVFIGGRCAFPGCDCGRHPGPRLEGATQVRGGRAGYQPRFR